MGKLVCPLVAGLAVLAASHVAAQSPGTAADLATRIQGHYDTVHDFRATFTQSYTSAILGQKAIEQGDVKIKKPNRMSWSYTAPNKKLFVADGVQMFDYEPNPAAPQCTVTPLPRGDQIPEGIMFLAGRGNLVHDFTSTVPATQAADTWRLDLVPKVPQEDFSALAIIVDRDTLVLRAFVTTDRDGNTQRFDFSTLKENVGLRDSEFTFTPPRGVRCEAPGF